MSTLGIVMAKSGSTRTPHKNIADICGRPTLSYAIEALRSSGVCNEIIVSTDSDSYGDIALAAGADDYVMRNAWTDNFTEFSITADDARKTFQERTGTTYDEIVVSGGNVMFLRPSWIRAAAIILREFAYNLMPIDVVGMEPLHWNVNVCRVREGIMTHPNFFVFKHIGILMEMDWVHELELARQIMLSIQDGTVDYPIDETVHDEFLANREQAANRMRGLTLMSDLIS